MKTISDKHDIALRNVGFSALLCASFGFIVLEAGLILAKAQPRGQVISVLAGAVVTLLIYRRIAKYWPLITRGAPKATLGKPGPRWNAADLLSGLLLLAIGCVGAKAVQSGWMLVTGLYAICLAYVPWSTLGLWRKSVGRSCLLGCAGIIAGLCAANQLPHPLLLIMAA